MSLKSIRSLTLCLCLGAVTLGSVNGFALGQTTAPSTQPTESPQPVQDVLMAKLLGDFKSLDAAEAAQDGGVPAAKEQIYEDMAQEINVSSADIDATRMAFFLQDPSQGGTRTWDHPEWFPKETDAMTVYTFRDWDVVHVAALWFEINGNGAITVSGYKPDGIDSYSGPMGPLVYPADPNLRVSQAAISEQVARLHRILGLAAVTLPEDINVLRSYTIYFQSERLSGYTYEYVATPPAAIYDNYYSPPFVAENGSYYGEISARTGLPRTNYVRGYYRADGTYVRSYYRSP